MSENEPVKFWCCEGKDKEEVAAHRCEGASDVGGDACKEGQRHDSQTYDCPEERKELEEVYLDAELHPCEVLGDDQKYE